MDKTYFIVMGFWFVLLAAFLLPAFFLLLKLRDFARTNWRSTTGYRRYVVAFPPAITMVAWGVIMLLIMLCLPGVSDSAHVAMSLIGMWVLCVVILLPIYTLLRLVQFLIERFVLRSKEDNNPQQEPSAYRCSDVAPDAEA